MTSTARRLLTACTALALVLPASAQAGTIAVDHGVLAIDAEASFLDVDISQDGADFSVFDYSGDLKPGAGCKAAPPDPTAVVFGGEGDAYTCTGDVASLRVTGGENGDFAYAFVTVPAVMTGGAGSDSFYTTGGDARLDGGDGDDELHSSTGADELIGGPGDDYLSSDRSAGEFEDGGDAPPPTGSADKLDGGPGRDYLAPGTGADTVSGGDGRDTLSLDTGVAATITLDTASSIEAV